MIIDDAINHVIGLEGKHGQKLKKIDRFAMPLVKLDVQRDVVELLNIPIANK